MTPNEAKAAKAAIARYNLLTTREFDTATPEDIARESNGIGPDKWPARFREAVTGLLGLFSLPAVIHDWEFGPLENTGTVERWHEANSRFAENCRKMVRATIPWYRFASRRAAMELAGVLAYAVETRQGREAWVAAYRRWKA